MNNSLKFYQIFLISLLCFTVIIIYSPILYGEYAVTDDYLMLRSYSGKLEHLSFNYIINTFKNCHYGLYHPLVTLSYSTEITLFSFIPEGFAPVIFHFDNILLHIANIILVFLIFFKLSNSFWLSFIITALFAIHPTRAEVVCWISARKDLLYAFFYLLSVLFYIKIYDNKKIKTYLVLSVIMFLLACFSKAMAITLPFVLILIDLYTNNFNKKNFKIYSVYIIATLFFISLNIYAHYILGQRYVYFNFNFTILNQLINFINTHFNILFYLDKLLIPINLYCPYPHFYNALTMPPKYILYSPAILYILIYLSFLSLRKTKIFFYGFMFFIITILPSSNILPIGVSPVADRYTYIPYLGLFFIFAKITMLIYKKNKKYIKILTTTFCLLIFITLNCLLYNRVIDWQKNEYVAPIGTKYYKFGIK